MYDEILLCSFNKMHMLTPIFQALPVLACQVATILQNVCFRELLLYLSEITSGMNVHCCINHCGFLTQARAGWDLA